MKLIVTGASGFVGSEIIRQSLQNPLITTVVAVARKPVSAPDGIATEKLRSVVVESYDKYPEQALTEFSGASACIWTVAVTPSKITTLSTDEVRKVCQEFTLAGLQAMHDSDPVKPFRFLYMSGAAAERDQTKRPWVLTEYCLMRGETENQVLRFADKTPGVEACIAKPGLITSYSTTMASVKATALSILTVIPNIDVETIAAALIHQAVAGFEQETLWTSDLKRVGHALSKSD